MTDEFIPGCQCTLHRYSLANSQAERFCLTRNYNDPLLETPGPSGEVYSLEVSGNALLARRYETEALTNG